MLASKTLGISSIIAFCRARLPSYRWIFLLLAASSLPLLIRLFHMWEKGFYIRRFDWSGIFCDLTVGTTATLLLMVMLSRHMILFLLAFLLWIGLNLAYYEFLHEYGSPFFLIHAGQMMEQSFVFGSASHISRPYLLFFSAAFIMLAVVVLNKKIVGKSFKTVTLVVLGLLIVVEVMPKRSNMTTWRQRDFVSANIIDVFRRGLRDKGLSKAQAMNNPQLDGLFSADLRGQPILTKTNRQGQNVLVIFIEGVSGGHLRINAERHENNNEIKMPNLDALARQGLVYSSFITHQRQSNRGLYAAFCGDYPRLAAGIPKMTEVANGLNKFCLPEILREKGYNTAFIKASNLDYMLMDQFLPKSGFNLVYGAEKFEPEYGRNNWGIYDDGLYKKAAEEIEELSKKDKPWFVSLFTVTTHHPYTLPANFDSSKDASPRLRAFQFADEAIRGLLEKLSAAGHLNNTLVLITSDESSGTLDIDGPKVAMLNDLSENWGLMIALTPEQAKGRIDETFQQADIAISILDYLGINDKKGSLIGRSLFRTYKEKRPFYFANLYKNRIYEYDENGILKICDERFINCQAYDTNGSSLFGKRVLEIDENIRPSKRFRAVQDRTLLTVSPSFAVPQS